jgi:hypothetical protein
MNEPAGPRKLGGSASVAGDQIAVSKESSLTGEVYVRADGKKGKSFQFDVHQPGYYASWTSLILFVLLRYDSTTCNENANSRPVVS